MGDQSGHFPHQTGSSREQSETRGRESIWLSPTKLEPAAGQSGTFPTKLGPAGSIYALSHQTRGSIWALFSPNWDQQRVNLRASPAGLEPAGATKLGIADDQSGHFPHQTWSSKKTIWALLPPNWQHFPHQTGTSRGPCSPAGPSGKVPRLIPC